MNNIQDLIEKIINPPGFLKKNRRALFDTIRDIGELVKKDALTAFNAHFPYLADAKKLQEHGDALLIPHLLHDTEAEYRERVASASFFLMKAGERAYIMQQMGERFGERFTLTEKLLSIYIKITELTDDERVWVLDLFDSLVNPNIYFGISDMVYFIDNINLYDNDKKIIQKFDSDLLPSGIQDIFVMMSFNEVNYTDTLAVNEKTSAGLRYHYFHDGSRKRDGSIQHKGMIYIPLE